MKALECLWLIEFINSSTFIAAMKTYRTVVCKTLVKQKEVLISIRTMTNYVTDFSWSGLVC